MTPGVNNVVHSELKFTIFQRRGHQQVSKVQTKIVGFVEWKWCKLGTLTKFYFESYAPGTRVGWHQKSISSTANKHCPTLNRRKHDEQCLCSSVLPPCTRTPCHQAVAWMIHPWQDTQLLGASRVPLVWWEEAACMPSLLLLLSGMIPCSFSQ